MTPASDAAIRSPQISIVQIKPDLFPRRPPRLRLGVGIRSHWPIFAPEKSFLISARVGASMYCSRRSAWVQGGKAYGLDMTDDMLTLARENQKLGGVVNVEFLKGEIENIPLPDDSVDVIISNCVINLSADKDRVLKEAFRVLTAWRAVRRLRCGRSRVACLK